MAENASPEEQPVSAGPAAAPATPPSVAPWLAIYTLGRLGILVVLVALLWLLRVPEIPALLFGVLLSMPVSYVLLRPARDRLTEALAARSVHRRRAKEELRARLSGEEEQP
jgi:hypothetical protein